MRVPAYLKGKYKDLIEQIMEMAVTKERGYREYREPSKHIRPKQRVGLLITTK